MNRNYEYEKLNDVNYTQYIYNNPKRFSKTAYSSYEVMLKDCHRMIREMLEMKLDSYERARWKEIILILIKNIRQWRGYEKKWRREEDERKRKFYA